MKKTAHRISAFRRQWPVLLLSTLSIELALLWAAALSSWDVRAADVFMRWRQNVRRQGQNAVHEDITIIAIDDQTLEQYGLYGRGVWLTRQPFVTQLVSFRQSHHPSVLAYDLLLKDTLGERIAGEGKVSRSPERLRAVCDELAMLAEADGLPRGSVVMSPAVSRDLMRVSAEQGDDLFRIALGLHEEWEDFPIVLAFHFIGGQFDPQTADVSRWSDSDVFGEDPSGDEEFGNKIPYLTDLRIPTNRVHFRRQEDADSYRYAINARLPGREFLSRTRLGFINVPPDEDGVVRRVPMMIGFEYKNSATRKLTRVFVPSFSLLTCMIHMGIEFPIRDGNPPPIEVWFGREIVLRGKEGPVRRIPIDNDGAMYVDFNASYEDFRRVNFVDAAVGDVSADVDGKLVMIGLAATGSTDIGPCPLSADTPLVHVHAMAASNILRGSHIAPIGTAARVALYCAVFVVMTAVCAVVRTLRLLPVPFVGAFGYGLVAYLSVHFGLAVMPVFAPLLYIGFCSFTVLGYRYWTEERGKRRIRNMFSTMVSADVLDYLEENPDSFSLAGHYADATVFFSDIADFTALSEGLPSVRVTEFLNSYLTPVTDCVMRHGGYVNKFMGDLVMAVWGAPFPTADHAEKACRAALEQQEIIAELNRGIAAKYGFEIRARMGVNTGMVAAGNMGSRRRSEYTVIGDVVNTASRIEPANRDYGTKILVSDATRKLVADSMVLRQVDRLIVKGKTEALDIYELMCEKESASVEILQLAGDYERALWRYFQMDWTGALAAADAILARGPDGPTEKLRKRILHYMENPPPKDWRRTRVRREKD